MSSHLSLTGLLPSAGRQKFVAKKPSLQDHNPPRPNHRHHNHHQRRPTAMTGPSTTAGSSSAGVTGIRAITNKAPLTIRPFAAIYNPYSKSCSVLCNHPATPEIKNVVKHAKQSWKHDAANPDHQMDNPYDDDHHLGREGRGRSPTSGGGGKHVTKHGQGKLIKIMEYDDDNQDGHDDDDDENNRHYYQQHHQSRRRRHHFDYDDLTMEPGVVPEEFLRRFTDTDSRPMTPTPTVLSNKTRASHHSSVVRHSRRCVTPEPENMYATEKKRLILDLRRSHSQETLFWNASSEFSTNAGGGGQEPGLPVGSCRRKAVDAKELMAMPGRGTAITGAGVEMRSGKGGKRNEANSSPAGMAGTAAAAPTSSSSPSLKPQQQQRGSSASSQAQGGGEAATGDGSAEQRNQMQKQLSCIYSKDDVDEEPRRRGKKKKKGKGQQETSTTFRPSQDPETQIANVPPDSTTQSQRPSIVANSSGGTAAALLGQVEQKQEPRGSKSSSEDFREAMGKLSFLDETLLSQLRRGLSIEAIETNFQIMMQRALKEALKSVPFEMLSGSGNVGGSTCGGGGGATGASPVRGGGGGGANGSAGGRGEALSGTTEPESIRGVKEALNLPHINHEKWLTLPRKYTRMVSRFELPIDSTELSRLSVLQYLSKYVQVSNYRKQLYHRIFVKFIPEIKLDDFGEINFPDWSTATGGNNNSTSSTSAANAHHGGPIMINHGVQPPPSPAVAAPSITEMFMNKRFIPFDQLKAALTTVLCPSASAEIIENLLEMLSIAHHRHHDDDDDNGRQLDVLQMDDATEKYYKGGPEGNNDGGGSGVEGRARVEEIQRNPPSSPTSSRGQGVGGGGRAAAATTAIARNPNGIIINMSTYSTSSLSLSAADYVPANALQINRDDARNGKLNIFDEDIRDGGIDSDKTSNDYNGTAAGGGLGTGTTNPPLDQTQMPFNIEGAKAVVTLDYNSASARLAGGSSATRAFSPTTAGANHSSGDGDEFLTGEIKINFRTWCGIVAFAERYSTNILKENDSRHEIEIVDFESLDRRINGIPIDPKLKQILYIIKN